MKHRCSRPVYPGLTLCYIVDFFHGQVAGEHATLRSILPDRRACGLLLGLGDFVKWRLIGVSPVVACYHIHRNSSNQSQRLEEKTEAKVCLLCAWNANWLGDDTTRVSGQYTLC